MVLVFSFSVNVSYVELSVRRKLVSVGELF